MPLVMMRPRPPRPAYDAMVTVAMTWSTADRKPPTIKGSPSGISTWVRICHSVMPLARAESMVPRSTDSRPE